MSRIRAEGGEAVAVPLDVTDDKSVADFAAEVTAVLGDIEVLVGNAGWSLREPPTRSARSGSAGR